MWGGANFSDISHPFQRPVRTFVCNTLAPEHLRQELSDAQRLVTANGPAPLLRCKVFRDWKSKATVQTPAASAHSSSAGAL